MNKKDLSIFCCLKCKGDLILEDFETKEKNNDNVTDGALVCRACRIFYPISENIPFLLDNGYYEYFDIKGFVKKWQQRFNFDNYSLLNRKIIPEKLKQLNFYNEDSNCYDDLVSHSKFWKVSDWNVLRRWLRELPKDSTILDIGCGTGRCAIPLTLSGRRVIATDLSIGMLKRAISKSKQVGVGHITYFLADAEDLPLKENLFSTVISFGLLHHVNDPTAIVKGAKKILKDKGAFYALENSASPLRPVFDLLMKFSKLWNEEAGHSPTFKIKEVDKFIKLSGMQPEIRTSTFLPPHLFNMMSHNLAKNTLAFTDLIFGNTPLVRHLGGQLIIKATKI
ncbi:MAG: methyltransferase domain-containing protein [Candidatus Omnitrophota bacterium]|jgi:ubiquinone/menaquinone biosynthesis C-methylase UbiE/uncharacterized protein YbaR (Trm112 family)